MATRFMRVASPSAELRALGAAIDGDVVMRDAETYEALRTPAVRQLNDLRPLAVVSCRAAEDVAHTLRLARRLGVPVVPRSGGHCFAGRSSTAGIVVDVSPMHGVDVTDEIATIGAGVRLGQLDEVLGRRGRTVPAGSPCSASSRARSPPARRHSWLRRDARRATPALDGPKDESLSATGACSRFVTVGGVSEVLVDRLVTPKRRRRAIDALVDEVTRIWLVVLGFRPVVPMPLGSETEPGATKAR